MDVQDPDDPVSGLSQDLYRNSHIPNNNNPSVRLSVRPSVCKLPTCRKTRTLARQVYVTKTLDICLDPDTPTRHRTSTSGLETRIASQSHLATSSGEPERLTRRSLAGNEGRLDTVTSHGDVTPMLTSCGDDLPKTRPVLLTCFFRAKMVRVNLSKLGQKMATFSLDCNLSLSGSRQSRA